MSPPVRPGLVALACALTLAGCATPRVEPSAQHLTQATAASPPTSAPPPALVEAPLPSAPRPAAKEETFSAVVHRVNVRELLFVLARDARVNIDIAPDVDGQVTLNAIDQTLPQILERISRQVDMRWERRDGIVIVTRDTPFLRNYRVDYVNLTRQSDAKINVATQINSSNNSATNSSETVVNNQARNRFWETLVDNLRDLLRETDKVLPAGAATAASPQASPQAAAAPAAGTIAPGGTAQSSGARGTATSSLNTAAGAAGTSSAPSFREAASVIANPETGVIAVRATGRQHERVQEFLDQVMGSAQRQVLIEATVVEVQLNDAAESGIDWSRVASGAGFNIRQDYLGAPLNPAAGGGFWPSTDANAGANVGSGSGRLPVADTTRGLTIGYRNSGSFAAVVKLLSQYGRTKVISSPKLTVLNNQPAVLRVVDNLVYFTITGQTTVTEGGTVDRNYTSTPNTVAVGFVMSVVPQIDRYDNVTLNVRPTISRLRGYARDPNPALTEVANLVPVVQTRELESIMRVPSGATIMMGGLMEDTERRSRDGVPGLSDLPTVGQAFGTRAQSVAKTELAVFLRPVVIRDASMEGSFAPYRSSLPGEGFFNSPSETTALPAGGGSAAPRP